MKRLHIVGLTVLIILSGCDTKNNVAPDQGKGFVKFYGSILEDMGADILEAFGGGYIVAGGSKNFKSPEYDAYLFKTDAEGDLEWEVNFGDTLNDEALSIASTADGGYILSGYSETDVNDTITKDVYLIKTDVNGTLQWQRKYGYKDSEDWGTQVIQTSDLGYLIVGTTTQANAANLNSLGTPDVVLIKTNALGDTVWVRQHGGAGIDNGLGVVERGNGDFVIIGTTTSFNDPGQAGSNILVIITNPLGFEISRKTYGGLGEDLGKSIILTNAGIAITGTTDGVTTSTDIYAAKIDIVGTSLNLDWEVVYGAGTENEVGIDIALTSGGFAVLSKKTVSITDDKFQLSFLDNNGVQLIKSTNTLEYGSQGKDLPKALINTSDGGYALTGQVAFENDKMVTIIKTDVNGDILN